MKTSHFQDLSLNRSILRALSKAGYQEPTAIQQATIPEALAGKDLLATAQTGTGKTAAFALPMLQMLHERSNKHTKEIRALILTPTRELALQIEASLRNYGRYLPLRTAVVMGGVPAGPQIKALRRNPDILVATPGRLIDLHDRRHIRLHKIEILVLDEADRMLDMGFVKDVRRIVSKLPGKRQTLFFSATLTSDIAGLASFMLTNPSRVEVNRAASVSKKISQKVLFVEQTHKRALLTKLLKAENVRRALVFTRTKHRANRVALQLSDQGVSADAIHSNKSQSARQRALSAFDRGRIKVLVGTDVVARGIDVGGISHVINYELPDDPESYVHRIGRTARAGAAGIALSFCDAKEVVMLRGIEKLIKSPLTAIEDHPFHSTAIAALREQSLAAVSRPFTGRRKVRSKNRTRRQNPRRKSY